MSKKEKRKRPAGGPSSCLRIYSAQILQGRVHKYSTIPFLIIYVSNSPLLSNYSIYRPTILKLRL